VEAGVVVAAEVGLTAELVPPLSLSSTSQTIAVIVVLSEDAVEDSEIRVGWGGTVSVELAVAAELVGDGPPPTCIIIVVSVSLLQIADPIKKAKATKQAKNLFFAMNDLHPAY
jgi:hypothetical protein